MGSVPSISNGGFVTFVDRSNTIRVFRAPLRRYNRVVKTIVSLWVSDCDLLLFNAKVSLALSSSCNHLISALVAVNSA